jgi:hypothetical protein
MPPLSNASRRVAFTRASAGVLKAAAAASSFLSSPQKLLRQPAISDQALMYLVSASTRFFFIVLSQGDRL